MTGLQGFQPIGEVTADSRGRLPVGPVGVHLHDRFVMARNADGDILLIPVASIPKRELLFWENPIVRESVLEGLRDLQEGRAHPMHEILDDVDGT